MLQGGYGMALTFSQPHKAQLAPSSPETACTEPASSEPACCMPGFTSWDDSTTCSTAVLCTHGEPAAAAAAGQRAMQGTEHCIAQSSPCSRGAGQEVAGSAVMLSPERCCADGACMATPSKAVQAAGGRPWGRSVLAAALSRICSVVSGAGAAAAVLGCMIAGPAAAEMDYSHKYPQYDGYNYEQYMYDQGQGESNNNWPNMYGDGYQRPDNRGSSSFEYGRDRYYGQEGVRCPENDGRGHHRPHPGCPEYNRPGAGYRPYQPSYGDRPYPPPSYGHSPYPPPSYHPQHPRPPHGSPSYPSDPDYGRPDYRPDYGRPDYRPDYDRPRPPRPPRPDYRPNNPALNGSINACLSFEQPDGTWSIDRPVKVDIIDGMRLYETLGISPERNYNNLYVVFNGFSHSYRDNVILPLKHRRSLSSAAIVLQDLQGRSWRISSSWRRCTR